MFNKSVSGLSILNSVSFSPLLTLAVRSSLILSSAAIARVTFPIYNINPAFRKVELNNVLAKQVLSSLAVTTQIVFFNQSFVSGLNPFDISSSNYQSVHVTSCRFDSVSEGIGPLLRGIQFIMNKTIVNNCLTKSPFVQLDTPTNFSSINDCTFTQISGPFVNTKKGSITIQGVTVSNSPKAQTFIEAMLCVHIYIEGCVFNAGGGKAIDIKSTLNSQIDQSAFINYKNTNAISISANSYAVVSYCCFTDDHTVVVDASSDSKVVFHEIYFKMTACPYVPTPTQVTEVKKAYAIATVVVFCFCFIALFVLLIVLVICKAGQDEDIQYGVLHDVDDNSDVESEGDNYED